MRFVHATMVIFGALSLVLGGCSGGGPTGPTPGSPSPQVPCQDTVCKSSIPCWEKSECIIKADDFICAGGPAGGCRVKLFRECIRCEPMWADYRLEEVTVRAFERVSGERSGRAYFPAGAKTAEIVLETRPPAEGESPAQVKVVVSANGVAGSAPVVTITAK